MPLEENNLVETSTILGVIFAVLTGVWKYITESFKDKRAEREAKILADERHQSTVITQAVRDGMEAFNMEIRREFKEYKDQTDKQFSTINRRIDDVMTKLDR